MIEINVIEAKKLIDEKINDENFELIDVRSPLEYNQFHLKRSKLIPLEELENHLEKFDKNKKYLIYCRTGIRSGIATKLLKSKGLKATNMQGGILDWIEKGYEIKKV